MQRLHNKVSWNWQKFTTMVYEINKSRDLKKRTRNHIWKKTFWIYDNDRKENTLIYAYQISYKKIRNFCRLFEPDYYTKLDKKQKKEEICLSPMTKAPTPTEMSKGQSDNTNNATKKFD